MDNIFTEADVLLPYDFLTTDAYLLPSSSNQQLLETELPYYREIVTIFDPSTVAAAAGTTSTESFSESVSKESVLNTKAEDDPTTPFWTWVDDKFDAMETTLLAHKLMLGLASVIIIYLMFFRKK